MDNNVNWYKITDIDQLDSPVLVVFPDRVKANIQTAIRMVGDTQRLRPHIKTHKSPEVVTLMMKAGITKFKCATIAEAEILGICGAKDVLLAYQPTGPKLQRFVELVKKYPATHFSCLTDNRNSAMEQSAIFFANGLRVDVYIDLNVGMNRTGIAPGGEAIQLYQYCATLEGIKPVGLHAYDGQIRNVDFNLRKEECDHAFAAVETMKEQLMKMGMEEPVIIAGGSHSFSIHCKRKNIECSPGTFIYWDKGNSDFCPEQAFLPAAVLVTRVVSLPNATAVCTDLGHKSVAAENELTKRVYFLNAPGLKAVGQSEEHLVLEAGEGHSYQAGDILYGLPIHVCPTVALYERVITIENGVVSGQWKNLARDRRISL
jgi:D-threonine aldolase